MTAVALAVVGTVLCACGGSGRTRRDNIVSWIGVTVIGFAVFLAADSF